jgi:hypothetical protein
MQHLIRRYIFDVQFTEQSEAKALQDRVSMAFHSQLSDVTEQVISRLVQPGEHWWIDRLELDLGKLSIDNFEESLAELLEEALKDALEALRPTATLTTSSFSSGSTSARTAASSSFAASDTLYFGTDTERKLALLSHYLVSGSLPAWSANQNIFLDELLIQLANDEPSSLSALVLSFRYHENILKRIAYHFSGQAVRKVIEVLEKAESDFIVSYVEEVLTGQHKKPIVKAELREFEQAVWLFVLSYLVTEHSGIFNRRSFVKSQLARIARHFNISYSDLLSAFRLASAYYGILPAFVDALWEEEFGVDQPHTHRPRIDTLPEVQVEQYKKAFSYKPSYIEHVEVLAWYQAHGSLPLWAPAYERRQLYELAGGYNIQTPAAGSAIYFRDLIMHWLSYGSIPWWAKESAGVSTGNTPIDWWRALLAADPEQAVAITQFAAEHPAATVRMNRLLAAMANTEPNLLSDLKDYATNTGEGASQQALTAHTIIDPALSTTIAFAPRLSSIPPEKVYWQNTITHIALPASWLSYDQLLIQEEKEEAWQQAVSLFTQVITGYRPLPAWFTALQSTAQGALVKQAVTLLYRKRPMLLTNLWEHPSHTVTSRIYIHSLFEKAISPLEENIRHDLSKYADKDAIRFLRQSAGSTVTIESFTAIWRHYRQQPLTERQAFYKEVLASVAITKQLATYLPEEDFWQVMEDAQPLWGQQTVTTLQQWHSWMSSLFTDSLERERFTILFRQFNLQWLSGNITMSSPSSYAEALLQYLHGFGETTTRKLIQQLTKQDIQAESYRHVQAYIAVVKATATSLLKKESSSAQAVLYEKDKQIIESLQPVEQAKTVSIANQQRTFTQPVIHPRINDRVSPPPVAKLPKVATSEQTGLYVTNAGLVILNPFFYTYFSRLGLLELSKFKDEDARHRAVYLLQRLVTEEEKPAEETMVLNKILCGMPLEEPLQTGIVLTDAEKQLAKELVHVATQQWDKMKNTSVDGFRNSFIIREGIVWQDEEAWFLKVTPRSYDIILQTLPWSMGMIRYSWTEKTLYTEWNIS